MFLKILFTDLSRVGCCLDGKSLEPGREMLVATPTQAHTTFCQLPPPPYQNSAVNELNKFNPNALSLDVPPFKESLQTLGLRITLNGILCSSAHIDIFHTSFDRRKLT